MKNVLPIGSVVKISGGEKRLMIVGYFPKVKTDGKVYDFIGCLYPEGFIKENLVFLFVISNRRSKNHSYI